MKKRILSKAVVVYLVAFISIPTTIIDSYISNLSAGEKEVLSKEFSIRGGATEGVVLEQNHRIKIVATGEGLNSAVSEANMRVMAMPDIVVISQVISLKNGETQSWDISPEKHPFNLVVNGKTGQIRFKIYQNP